ncbi:MAG: hypothetical protein KDA78_18365, partial [Planctomycetaceae bacterium]|nr:hypothetical protein [Planctomycetaceae bacterium]
AIFDARPLFTNLGTPAGPGVTFDLVGALGGTVISNDVTEFSGFVLGNPDGTDPTSGDSLVTFDPTTTVAPGQGPSGNGIEYVTLGTTATATRFVDIHGAENNGLHFVGTSGTFELQSVIINQSGNHEMFVSGGDPTINYRSTSAADRSTLTDGQFTNRLESVVVNRDNLSGLAPAQFAGFPGTTTGAPGDNHDLLVQATTGGAVNWIDVITNDQGGDGFLITLASQSNVTIPVSTTIINSRGNGIAVMPGSSGAITISSTRTDLQTFGGMFITNPAANAIQIGLPVDPVLATPPGIETAATVSFVQPITINQLDQQNSGVMIANTSGNTVFQGTSLMTIDYNNPATSAGTAAGFEFFQNFSGNLTLNNALTINNSGGPGFRISNDLDAGFPDGGPGDVFYFSPPNAGFLTINNAAVNQGVGGAALLIGADSPAGNPSNSVAGSGYEGNIRFAAPININNSNGAGIQANFNTGDITFSNGVIVNANLTTTASQVGLFDNAGDILFTTLTINNFRGADIDFLDDNEPTPAELAAMTASLDMRRNTGDLVFNDLTVFSNGTAVLPSATGVFGYNNRVITIQDAEIDVFGATAVEIFTANSAVPLAPPFGLTDLSLELVDVNSTLAPDHGIHLANLKGQAIIDGGDISLGGSSLGDEFPGQDYEAGIYVDNSLLRTRELANFGVIFGQSRSFSLDITQAQGGLDLDLNTKGILGIAFDDLTIDGAGFRLNDREALDLIDVVNVEITGTTFVDNQNFNIGVGGPTVEFATLRSVYTLTLN